MGAFFFVYFLAGQCDDVELSGLVNETVIRFRHCLGAFGCSRIRCKVSPFRRMNLSHSHLSLGCCYVFTTVDFASSLYRDSLFIFRLARLLLNVIQGT